MAGFWRHNGAWIWDLLNKDNPAWPAGRDASPWFGNSLLWDGATGTSDPGFFAADPQRFAGLTAGFDITGVPGDVPSLPLPPVMPAQIIALGDVADLPVNEITPPVPTEPSPPVEPPVPPVTPPNTLPVNQVTPPVPNEPSPPVEPPLPPVTPLPINQVPDASLLASMPPQQLGVASVTDPGLIGIPNH